MSELFGRTEKSFYLCSLVKRKYMRNCKVWLLSVLACVCLSVNGQMLQDIEGQKVQTDNQKKVDISLGFGLNAGFVTSKVYTPAGDYSWEGGMGYDGEVNCVFASGYGFGVDYEHSETSYPVGRGLDYSLKLDFVMPHFMYSAAMNEEWLLRAKVGLGYAHYNDGEKAQTGFGFKTGLGVEHMFSRHLGVALQLEQRTAFFSEPDSFSYYKKNNEKYGYSRLSVNLELIYHL